MDAATETELVGLLQAVEKIADNAAKRRTKKIAAIVPEDELAIRIKKAMVSKGLSQEKVVQRMGITRVSLSNKINGKSSFTLSEAFLLADILKVPFDDLFFKYPY